MKLLYSILLTLCLVSPVWADGMIISPQGSSYIFQENFEGTGYENSWTETCTSATCDEDYTTAPAPLEGSQSFYIDVNTDIGTKYIEASFTATDPVYFYVIFNIGDFPDTQGGNDHSIVQLLDSVDTAVMGVVINTSTNLLKVRCNTSIATSATTVAQSTTYHVWGAYDAGSGANSACSVYIATSATKPGSPDISTASGDSTATASKIRLRATDTASYNIDQIIFDKVRVSNVEIGSNPQ